jgi:hypothetical protein
MLPDYGEFCKLRLSLMKKEIGNFSVLTEKESRGSSDLLQAAGRGLDLSVHTDTPLRIFSSVGLCQVASYPPPWLAPACPSTF